MEVHIQKPGSGKWEVQKPEISSEEGWEQNIVGKEEVISENE